MNEDDGKRTGRRVAFITLGCKVNQYDTDAMRGLFLKRGYEPAEEGEEADVYVINTCSVTQTGDRKSRQMIRRMRREHPKAVIAAAGCYAQLAPGELSQIDGLNVIVGTQNRAQIVNYVESCRPGEVLNKVTDIMECRSFENLSIDGGEVEKTRAFMKIQEGCNNYCTFCIIPYARGRLKSRPVQSAVEEAERLASQGYKEIVLTGIHLGNYGVDLRDGTTLASLIRALLPIRGLERIRIGSIESVELSQELIELMRTEPKVCRHLHLPLQSGSETILHAMNRHYHLEEYKKLISNLREEIPDLAVTTDLIVGFPGETEELFQETLQTLDELRFSGIHVFPYSRRKGTPAAAYPDQVSETGKKERVHRVQKEESGWNREFRSGFIGRIVHVLAEEERDGLFEGLAESYIRVSIKGDGLHRGEIYPVKIEALTAGGLIGTAVREDY